MPPKARTDESTPQRRNHVSQDAVRTQVARRAPDGRWVWVRDGSRLRDVEACLPAQPGALAVA